MITLNPTPIMASFATMKSLNDSRIYSNAYQVLSEFINYIVCEKKLYVFTSIEIKNKLIETFGFDIPEAVVKTALRNLSYIEKKNHSYIVDASKLEIDSHFGEVIENSEQESAQILDKIYTYIEEKCPNQVIDRTALTRDFLAFLVDDQESCSGKYTNLISEFVLNNEDNTDIQNKLNAVREGSILYLGLNYNICETGSITKPITLYLDTEILFNLIGYNGEIYQKITADLFDLIKSAKANGAKIQLCYFGDVKTEITNFFNTAKSIVEGKFLANNKVAMKAIINNCEHASDVAIKEADFFHTIKFSYGIEEDSDIDYYDPKFDTFNLESIDVTDPQEQDSWKFISHINKLRRGKVAANTLESEYLIVTSTSSTLKASKAQVSLLKSSMEMETVNDYAVTTNKMTNLLWYKLGKGFGHKDFPNNVSAVIRARMVLASSVSHNVCKLFEETKQQYLQGKISKDQLAARILCLRKKPILPEDIDNEEIDESLDFSDEYISQYEEQASSNRKALEQKDQEISDFRLQHLKELSTKERIIKEKDQIIEDQITTAASNQQTISQQGILLAEQKEELDQTKLDKKDLEAKIAVYQEREANEEKRKKRRKNISKFVGILLLKILILSVIFCAISYWHDQIEKVLGNFLITFEIIGVLGTVWSIIFKDIKKYFRSTDE